MPPSPREVAGGTEPYSARFRSPRKLADVTRAIARPGAAGTALDQRCRKSPTANDWPLVGATLERVVPDQASANHVVSSRPAARDGLDAKEVASPAGGFGGEE